MAFTRKNINNQSTFQVGAEVAYTNTPSFQQWTNVTTSQGLFWSLGDSWAISVSSDETSLHFNLNGVSVAEITADGLQVTAGGSKLALTNLTTLPPTGENSPGTMVRSNGEMYILIDDGGIE